MHMYTRIVTHRLSFSAGCFLFPALFMHLLFLFEQLKCSKTRLTYNCAHLRSTKESLTDSVKKFFVRKFFWVKFFLGENFLGRNFLGDNFFGENFLGENV